MIRHKTLSLIVVTATFTACTGLREYRGDQAFDLMQYPKAERNYELVLRDGENRQVRAKLARSYRKHNEWTKAAEHFGILHSAAPLTGDTAMEYGETLFSLGRSPEAADLFLRVIEEYPENSRAVDLYESALGYKSFYLDSGRFIVNRLTLPGISTAFGSIPYKNGIIIAGEREMDKATGNPWNERSYLDLYHSVSKTEVTWSEVEPLPGMVNGPYHEGPAALGPDGRTIYFTRSNYVQRKLSKDDQNTSHLKLFRATLDSSGQWTGLHAFAYNSEDWSTGHPTVSPDGNWLYFSSDRPGGYGGSDIWRSRDNGTGWSEPENLGPFVNTTGNELFPVLNGNALHFSSTAHNNMGGLDIFETHEQDGKWSEPVNMKAPINTPKDDFHFVLDSTGKAGYLSSDREGMDQVYAFTMYEPLFYLDGIVLDEEDRFLPNTGVTLLDMTSGDDNSMLIGPDGKFAFQLKPNTDYTIKAENAGHLTNSINVSTKGLTRSDTLHAEIRMTSLRVGEPIAINNIYYDYDKWDIRPDAAVELDKLLKIFNDNPTMTFELGSHTDSRGGDMYNLVLSDARANSAVDYLIRHGVAPDRISAKGYGETVLINHCRNGVRCTEKDHQDNRRTEFTVTGVANIASNHSRP